ARLRVSDPVRKRFGETAGLVAAHQDARAEATAARLRALLTTTGEERALDVGTGAGALALALAPRVREAVGVDVVPELLAEARSLADVALRGLFDANGRVLRQAEVVREPRDLEPYLDLAGCEGEEREQARGLAPADTDGVYGWYVLRKPGLGR